jgi:hypothetical protein
VENDFSNCDDGSTDDEHIALTCEKTARREEFLRNFLARRGTLCGVEV